MKVGQSDGTTKDEMVLTGRKATIIQTQNAVSVGASTGVSNGVWMDCMGFESVSVILKNDNSTNSYIDLEWSTDGITVQGSEALIATAPRITKAGNTKVKARYGRVVLGNTDAAAHTMSAWAYLTA